MHVCHRKPEGNLQEWLSPSIIWVPETEFRLLGLVALAFTCWAILLIQEVFQQYIVGVTS